MKVLIAIDGTECSSTALDHVLHRPWHRNDEFKILTIVEPMPTEFGIDENESQEDYFANMVASSNLITNRAQQKLRSKFPHNELSTEILLGKPADEIVECAREWGADLILVGTHGHRDCRRFLDASVSESILRHAPCSVEVIKVKENLEAANDSSLDYCV